MIVSPLFLGGALLCCAVRHPLRLARYSADRLHTVRRSIDYPAVRAGLLLVAVGLPVAATAGAPAAIGLLGVFATQLRWRGGHRESPMVRLRQLRL